MQLVWRSLSRVPADRPGKVIFYFPLFALIPFSILSTYLCDFRNLCYSLFLCLCVSSVFTMFYFFIFFLCAHTVFDFKLLYVCVYPQCGSTGCLGLARFLSDCQSCLVFSGVPNSLPRAPGDFGWCVQNDSCLPVSGMSIRAREDSINK